MVNLCADPKTDLKTVCVRNAHVMLDCAVCDFVKFDSIIYFVSRWNIVLERQVHIEK